jgi:hypothetical protein
MHAAQVLGILCLGLGWAHSLAAAQGRPLPQKHVKAGVTCHDCHQAEAPAKAADGSACMDCHGDLPAMAAATKDRKVNPHAVPKPPHPGPFACVECHRQHRPPAVRCLECHPKFVFSVK